MHAGADQAGHSAGDAEAGDAVHPLHRERGQRRQRPDAADDG